MKIEAYSVVSLNYILKNANGEIMDQSLPDEPLIYMHGTDYLVPGLEKAITGHQKGDSFSVIVSPEEGYGIYQNSLVQKLSVAVFGGNNVEVGETYVAQTEEGPRPVIVTSIDDQWITVDGNHPLAGQELHFEIEITDVRAATEDEKNHGHVHVDGHCCCHGHDEGHNHHCCCHHHDHDDDEEHHCKCGHHHDDEKREEQHCKCGHHHEGESHNDDNSKSGLHNDEHKHCCCHHHEHHKEHND